MARISDIARIVGISRTAVSEYFRDKNTTRVSSRTKEAIEIAAEKLNSNQQTRNNGIKSNKIYSVGMIVPFEGPIFRSSVINSLMSGIHFEFTRNNFELVYSPTFPISSSSIMKNQVKLARRHRGVIVIATRFWSLNKLKECIQRLVRYQIPYVTINAPEIEEVKHQVIIRETISQSPIKHLLDLGHKKILLLLGSSREYYSIATLDQCRELEKIYNVEFDPSLVLYGEFEKDVAKSVVYTAITKKLEFTAVYALSDTMAVGVYQALEEAGLRIPDDVSVIGRNGSYFAKYLNPPLSTLQRPLYEAGRSTFGCLQNAITAFDYERKIYLESELIIRSSTKSLLT